MKFYIYFILITKTVVLANNIQGTVSNQYDGKPLAGVNITNDSIGTTTDNKGRFTINVKRKTPLKFSHIGFRVIILPASSNMNVTLTPKSIRTDEVMVLSGLSEKSNSQNERNITVLDSDDITNSSANHFQTLMENMPNLSWAGGTSRPRYFQIRGIGETSHYFGEGPPNFSIGFIFDDLELSGIGMLGNLFDVMQIETYKGPQSTIFGANAIGGVISIRSYDPTDSFDLKISSGIGTDNNRRFSTAINIPIVKNLRMRFTSDYNYSDGFRTNNYLNTFNSNKREEFYSRIKIKYHYMNKIFVLGSFLYTNFDNGYDAWAPDNNKQYITYTDQLGKDSQKTTGSSLRLRLNIADDFDIVSITSFTNSNLVHAYDGDWGNDVYWYENYGFDSEFEGWRYSFFDENNRVRDCFTQEIRFLNENFIFGFYNKDLNEIDEAAGYLFGGLATNAKSNYDFKVFSGYAEYKKKISSKVRVLLNARIENNIIDYKGVSYGYQGYSLPNVNFNTKNILTGYRCALISKQSSNLTINASIAKGFKSGGINQQPYLNDLNRPFGPESLISFELGMRYNKSNFKSNLIGFLGIRENQQISISSQQFEGDPNSFLYYVSNSGSGHLRGVELENEIKITPKLNLNFSGGYLYSWVDEFNYYLQNDIMVTGGNRETAMSPKYTASIGLKIQNENGLYSGISASYKSAYYFSDGHNQRSDPYFLTNLFISKSIGKVNLKLWARNIMNQFYANRGFYFGLIPPNYPNQLYVSYGDPRQMGITIDYELNR